MSLLSDGRDRALADGFLSEDVTYFAPGEDPEVASGTVVKAIVNHEGFEASEWSEQLEEGTKIHVSDADVTSDPTHAHFKVVPRTGGAAKVMAVDQVVEKRDGWWVLELGRR